MCSERLQQIVDALQTSGLLGRVDVIAFGSGSPAQGARVLRQFLGLGKSATSEEMAASPRRIRMYVDEGKEMYKYMSLHRGVVRTFTWHRWENFMGMCAFPSHAIRGTLPMVNAGDPWQQGGVFVMTADAEPLYTLREEAPGWPQMDTDAVITACKRLARPASQCAGTPLQVDTQLPAGAGADGMPTGLALRSVDDAGTVTPTMNDL